MDRRERERWSGGVGDVANEGLGERRRPSKRYNQVASPMILMTNEGERDKMEREDEMGCLMVVMVRLGS